VTTASLSTASPRELIVFEGARQITASDTVIVGTGLPLLAGLLAQRAHAPAARLVIESGVVFPRVKPTPLSVVDPRIMHHASRLGSLVEALGGLVQRGHVDTGFLGGAQVDQWGNINSTWINRDGGRVRLPGSGGANDIASLCEKVVILTDHEKRRFPATCDYVTSPGFLSGPGGRERAGLPPLRLKVITDLCVMEADGTTGRLCVTALMPGSTVDDVVARTGFAPDIATDLAVVARPAPADLALLRDVLDPEARYFPERRPSLTHHEKPHEEQGAS